MYITQDNTTDTDIVISEPLERYLAYAFITQLFHVETLPVC
jgi:hypothetical protein